jgi:plasmid stabilization system protein ParE
MIRYQLNVSRRAMADVSRILDGVRAASRQGAASLASSIGQAIDTLLETPYRTVVAVQPPSRLDPVRSMPIGDYMVFVRTIERTRTVRILRVRHGDHRGGSAEQRVRHGRNGQSGTTGERRGRPRRPSSGSATGRARRPGRSSPSTAGLFEPLLR